MCSLCKILKKIKNFFVYFINCNLPHQESDTFPIKYPGRSVEGVDLEQDNNTHNTDRMSVRSATLSLYKSEESLDRPGNGKSLPASPFIRRPSKSNSFHSHVRLPEKYDSRHVAGSHLGTQTGFCNPDNSIRGPAAILEYKPVSVIQITR